MTRLHFWSESGYLRKTRSCAESLCRMRLDLFRRTRQQRISSTSKPCFLRFSSLSEIPIEESGIKRPNACSCSRGRSRRSKHRACTLSTLSTRKVPVRPRIDVPVLGVLTDGRSTQVPQLGRLPEIHQCNCGISRALHPRFRVYSGCPPTVLGSWSFR